MVFHSDELRKEARQLKKELLAIKQRRDEGFKKEEKRSEGKCRHHMITAAGTDPVRIEQIHYLFLTHEIMKVFQTFA